MVRGLFFRVLLVTTLAAGSASACETSGLVADTEIQVALDNAVKSCMAVSTRTLSEDAIRAKLIDVLTALEHSNEPSPVLRDLTKGQALLLLEGVTEECNKH